MTKRVVQIMKVSSKEISTKHVLAVEEGKETVFPPSVAHANYFYLLLASFSKARSSHACGRNGKQ